MNHMTLPDITRSEVGTILVSPWHVGNRQRQRDAVDATMAQWRAAPWPVEFLSLNCFVSTDGTTVLNYAQWIDDDAHREFVRSHRPAMVHDIDDAVPGVERPGLVRYRLYDSVVAPGRNDGDLVAVHTFETNGFEEARRLADDARDRLTGGEEFPAGLAAAHFHISIDGDRVLVYEEWADETSAARAAHHRNPSARGTLYRLRRSLTRHFA